MGALDIYFVGSTQWLNRQIITINTHNGPLYIPINYDGYSEWGPNTCRIDTPILFDVKNDLLLLIGVTALEHPESWNKTIVFNGPDHVTMYIPSSFPIGTDDHITLLTLNK